MQKVIGVRKDFDKDIYYFLSNEDIKVGDKVVINIDEFQTIGAFLRALDEWKQYRAIGTVEECRNIKKWKDEAIKELCRYDANSFEELIQRARNKSVDEFMAQMQAEIESSAKFIREYDDSIAQKAWHSALCNALKTAEQLKAGVKNE